MNDHKSRYFWLAKGLFLLFIFFNPTFSQALSCSKLLELITFPKDYILDLSKRISPTIKIFTGTALKQTSPESFEIFEKIKTNPLYTLNSEELTRAQAEGIEPIIEQYRSANIFVKSINQKIAILFKSNPGVAKRKGWKRLYEAWRFLIPVPPKIREWRVKSIYEKVFKNPGYQLNDQELNFLAKFQLEQDIERYRIDSQKFHLQFITIEKIKTVGNYIKYSVALSTAAMALIGVTYISDDESFDEDSQKGMSRYDDKVELIFLSPLPHSSVKVRGIVYNYGIFTIDRLRMEDFRRIAGFGEYLSGSHTRIELNLTEDEKDKLQQLLEADVGKVYPLIIPWNDCISMTNKIIDQTCGLNVPPLADRSQSMSIAYYKLQKLLGNGKVGSIKFASKKGNALIARAQDLTTNVLDTLFFIRHGKSTVLLGPVFDTFIEPKEVKYKDEKEK